MGVIQIGFESNDIFPRNYLSTQKFLEKTAVELKRKRETINLIDFLKENGARVEKDPQQEFYIIKIQNQTKEVPLNELQTLISSKVDFQFLCLSRIGNQFQWANSCVQGHNPLEPKSGFERLNIKEGPHMILCLFSRDGLGNLRIFRTLQLRNDYLFVDTVRGFADHSTLESGEVLYNISDSEDKILENIYRVIKDESGDKIKINKIIFLGSPIVNSSFVTSKSATFGVEVDYNHFVELEQVVNSKEIVRRQREFEHEGLTNYILNLSVAEYLGYKFDTEVIHDQAADGPSDIIVMQELAKRVINKI